MEGQQREALCDLPAFGTLFSVKGDRPFVELYRIGQQHAQEEAGSPQTHEIFTDSFVESLISCILSSEKKVHIVNENDTWVRFGNKIVARGMRNSGGSLNFSKVKFIVVFDPVTDENIRLI
ncbi:unnamed protein product [Larinioides sclopetarius]|uniref:Uncharacterized protein n=1 Tax=Larinioides sclopetarius TaxID=280406 RepID=A0AAV1ZV18_9ARAC